MKSPNLLDESPLWLYHLTGFHFSHWVKVRHYKKTQSPKNMWWNHINYWMKSLCNFTIWPGLTLFHWVRVWHYKKYKVQKSRDPIVQIIGWKSFATLPFDRDSFFPIASVRNIIKKYKVQKSHDEITYIIGWKPFVTLPFDRDSFFPLGQHTTL